MKITAIVVAFLALSSSARTQPASAEYLINASLFSADAKSPGTLKTFAKPMLRTIEGRPAALTLGEDANTVSVSVTPSDLGGGKVGLHVTVAARMEGRVTNSTFDLLSGVGMAPATVALRDVSGALVLWADGQPMFVALEATKRQ